MNGPGWAKAFGPRLRLSGSGAGDSQIRMWLVDALSATKVVAIKQISAARVHLLPGFPDEEFRRQYHGVTKADAVGIYINCNR